MSALRLLKITILSFIFIIFLSPSSQAQFMFGKGKKEYNANVDVKLPFRIRESSIYGDIIVYQNIVSDHRRFKFRLVNRYPEPR